MPADTQNSYTEAGILGAGGCRLVAIVYQAALETVSEARQHLARGQIRARSGRITRASEILNELAFSVNHEAGGELSRNLAGLYDYIQFLLVKANTEQADAPLAEAESLLRTLKEAWEWCAVEASPALPPLDPASTGQTQVDCVG